MVFWTRNLVGPDKSTLRHGHLPCVRGGKLSIRFPLESSRSSERLMSNVRNFVLIPVLDVLDSQHQLAILFFAVERSRALLRTTGGIRTDVGSLFV